MFIIDIVFAGMFELKKPNPEIFRKFEEKYQKDFLPKVKKDQFSVYEFITFKEYFLSRVNPLNLAFTKFGQMFYLLLGFVDIIIISMIIYAVILLLGGMLIHMINMFPYMLIDNTFLNQSLALLGFVFITIVGIIIYDYKTTGKLVSLKGILKIIFGKIKKAITNFFYNMTWGYNFQTVVFLKKGLILGGKFFPYKNNNQKLLKEISYIDKYFGETLLYENKNIKNLKISFKDGIVFILFLLIVFIGIVLIIMLLNNIFALAGYKYIWSFLLGISFLFILIIISKLEKVLLKSIFNDLSKNHIMSFVFTFFTIFLLILIFSSSGVQYLTFIILPFLVIFSTIYKGFGPLDKNMLKSFGKLSFLLLSIIIGIVVPIVFFVKDYYFVGDKNDIFIILLEVLKYSVIVFLFIGFIYLIYFILKRSSKLEMAKNGANLIFFIFTFIIFIPVYIIDFVLFIIIKIYQRLFPSTEDRLKYYLIKYDKRQNLIKTYYDELTYKIDDFLNGIIFNLSKDIEKKLPKINKLFDKNKKVVDKMSLILKEKEILEDNVDIEEFKNSKYNYYMEFLIKILEIVKTYIEKLQIELDKVKSLLETADSKYNGDLELRQMELKSLLEDLKIQENYLESLQRKVSNLALVRNE